MQQFTREAAGHGVLRKVSRVFQPKRAAAQPSPAVRAIQAGIRHCQPLGFQPGEGLGHGKADLWLTAARVGWLAGHIVPKLAFEVAGMITSAEVHPAAYEEQQLGGQLLRLQGEQHIGVRDGLAELQHGPLCTDLMHDKGRYHA